MTRVCQGEAPQALPDEDANKLFSKSSSYSPFVTYRTERVGSPIAHYSPDQVLSTIVQNFFAFYGVFALHKRLTTSNFGEILNSEAQADSALIKALRTQLNTVMGSQAFREVDKTLVEDALCRFIATYKAQFRLTRVLDANEIDELKLMFRECWRMNYHAPHWDELFFFFPQAENQGLGYFLQSSFCIHLETFAEKLRRMRYPFEAQDSRLFTAAERANHAALEESNRALSKALIDYSTQKTSRRVRGVTPPSTVLAARYQPFSTSVTLSLSEIKRIIWKAVENNNEELLSILIKTITREGGYVFEQLEEDYFTQLNAHFFDRVSLLWQALIPKLPIQCGALQRFKAKVMPQAGQEYFVIDRFAELKLRAAVQSCCELTVKDIYRPFSAESTKFYLNKLNELANSPDAETKRHCAIYAGVNLVNVSTSSENAEKCILRGSPADITKIKTALTKNDKLVYLSSRQASALYKAVGDIYGLASSAYRDMMPLNNNTPGDPRSYRLERAFELLHLTAEVEGISYNNTINSREYMNARNRENKQAKKGGSGFCVTIKRGVDPHTFIRKIEEYETAYANQFVLDAEAKTALFTSVEQQAPGLLALYHSDVNKVKAAFLLFGIEHQGIYDRDNISDQSVLTFCDMKNQGILKHLLINGQLHLSETQQNNKKRFPINNEDKQYLGADYQPCPVSALDQVNLSKAAAVKSTLDRLQAQQDSVVSNEAVPVNASQNMVIDTLTKREAFSLYTALLDRQGLPPNRISKFATPETLSLCLADLARFYPEIDVENTTLMQAENGSLGVRTTAETLRKLKAIAVEYRNTVYISMIMAPALYKEVEKRYGRTSFAYQFMQALGNNVGDSIPHKFMVALTLLDINLPLNGIRYNNTRDKQPDSTDFGGGGFVVDNVDDDLLRQFEAITAENHDLTIVSLMMYSNLETLFEHDPHFHTSELIGLDAQPARKLEKMLSLLGITFSGQVEAQANSELCFKVHMIAKEVSKLKHVLRTVPDRLCSLPQYQDNILSAFDLLEFQQLERALSVNQKTLLNQAKSDNFNKIRFTQEQANNLKAALGTHPLAQKIRTLFIDEKEVLWNNDDKINVEGYQLRLHVSGNAVQPTRGSAFPEGRVVAVSNSSSREPRQEGSERLFKQACRVAGFLAQYSVNNQKRSQSHQELSDSATTLSVNLASEAYPLAILRGPKGEASDIYLFPNLVTEDYGNFDAWFTRIGDKPTATQVRPSAPPLRESLRTAASASSPAVVPLSGSRFPHSSTSSAGVSSAALSVPAVAPSQQSTFASPQWHWMDINDPYVPVFENNGAASVSSASSSVRTQSIFSSSSAAFQCGTRSGASAGATEISEVRVENTRIKEELKTGITKLINIMRSGTKNVRQESKICRLQSVITYLENELSTNPSFLLVMAGGITLTKILQLIHDICKIKARKLLGMFHEPAALGEYMRWTAEKFPCIQIDTVTTVDENVVLDDSVNVSAYLANPAPRCDR